MRNMIGSTNGFSYSFLHMGHLYGFVLLNVLKQSLQIPCLHFNILLSEVSHIHMGHLMWFGLSKSLSELYESDDDKEDPKSLFIFFRILYHYIYTFI